MTAKHSPGDRIGVDSQKAGEVPRQGTILEVIEHDYGTATASPGTTATSRPSGPRPAPCTRSRRPTDRPERPPANRAVRVCHRATRHPRSRHAPRSEERL